MNLIFFQCLPNKTFQLESEKCSGEKHSKIKIIGLAVANATGEKLPMFVIGKAKNPRCLKNIQTLQCRYQSQKKSWMDSVTDVVYRRTSRTEMSQGKYISGRGNLLFYKPSSKELAQKIFFIV